MKCVLALALCLGVALARPSALQQEEKSVEKEGILDFLLKAASDSGSKTDGGKTDSGGKSGGGNDPDAFTWDDLAKKIGIRLSSMGSVGNNPSVEAGVDGQLYHKLSFKWGEGKEYELYVDHLLNEFAKGDGGTLGVVYSSPLWKLGNIAIRGGQSFNDAANGTLDWRLDLGDNYNDQEWN